MWRTSRSTALTAAAALTERMRCSGRSAARWSIRPSPPRRRPIQRRRHTALPLSPPTASCGDDRAQLADGRRREQHTPISFVPSSSGLRGSMSLTQDPRCRVGCVHGPHSMPPSRASDCSWKAGLGRHRPVLARRRAHRAARPNTTGIQPTSFAHSARLMGHALHAARALL